MNSPSPYAPHYAPHYANGHSSCGCDRLTHDLATICALAVTQFGEDFGAEYARNLVKIEAKERVFAKRARVLMKARGVWLLRWFDREFGQASDPAPITHANPPSMPGSFTALLEVFASELFVLGALEGRRDVFAAMTPTAINLGLWEDTAGGPGVDEAIEFVTKRRELFKWFDQGVEDRVRVVLVNAITNGEPKHVTRKALAKVLTDYSKGRLDNVIETESIAAFNAGRLQYFDSVPHLVPGVRFMAVIDNRTSDICRERNGLVLALDDPLVSINTPPLHYRCRSSWAPCTVTRLELMARMSGQAIGDYLGGQRAKWEGAKAPLAGFGFVERVRPKPPRPADPKAAGKTRKRGYWKQVWDSLQALMGAG